MRLSKIPNVNRILVRAPNWIGDAVMTTPAMAAIRNTFPDAEISILAKPAIAELFQSHSACDRIIIFDKSNGHKSIQGLWQLTRELKQSQFDMAILMQNAFQAAAITFLAGIPIRAGYRTDGRRLLLNYGIPMGSKERQLHHVDYYFNMVKALGIKGPNKHLTLECTKQETAWSQDTFGQQYAVIAPGATYGSAKKWKPERFAAVADSLGNQFDFKIVFIGDQGDQATGNQVAAQMQSQPINLIGKTSVRQMLAIIASSRLLVTNDSGPMHVAAAFNTPLIAIFGSTDHQTTSPQSKNARMIYHRLDCAPCLKRHCPTDHACMEAVTVNDVMATANKLINDTA
ncbi:MAG: lipopolysaccharide heptosyltransferase II [Desulfobacterales bacterium]|nr:lipopolysaccharide heptosyltransferase II [Desulfobacterales bacterium]